MKKKFIIYSIIAGSFVMTLGSCKKDYGNLNSPTLDQVLDNPSADILNNLVTGSESGMRNSLAMYLDVVGMIGRDMYRFSSAEPRYTSDLLGAENAVLNNNTFYITNPWGARYQVVKNANVLIQAAGNSTKITDAERKGYTGFAKMIKAYQLLLNLNLTYNNGIRTDVADPDNLGPVVDKDQSLATIAALLDEAAADLNGAEIAFSLSSGFAGFNDAAGLTAVINALSARVAVYRQQWTPALDYLNASFFDMDGDFNTGVNHIFTTGAGDQLNGAFFPQNQNGEVRLAHPSYTQDIEAGDDRIGKATERESAATQSDLTADRDVWVFTSSTAPIPIIRNEELILIYAEANIQNNNLTAGRDALDIIRTKHGLPAYSGALTKDALITEMLNQRRYSLFFEGHRWVDMRRYGRLAELPIDRSGDDVWQEMPLPLTEEQ